LIDIYLRYLKYLTPEPGKEEKLLCLTFAYSFVIKRKKSVNIGKVVRKFLF